MWRGTHVAVLLALGCALLNSGGQGHESRRGRDRGSASSKQAVLRDPVPSSSTANCMNRCCGKGTVCKSSRGMERKIQLLICHHSCEICPASVVDANCMDLCRKECMGITGGSLQCGHKCLAHCPCEDVSPEIQDVIDQIPDQSTQQVDSLRIYVRSDPADENSQGEAQAAPRSGQKLVASSLSDVPVNFATKDIKQRFKSVDSFKQIVQLTAAEDQLGREARSHAALGKKLEDKAAADKKMANRTGDVALAALSRAEAHAAELTLHNASIVSAHSKAIHEAGMAHAALQLIEDALKDEQAAAVAEDRGDGDGAATLRKSAASKRESAAQWEEEHMAPTVVDAEARARSLGVSARKAQHTLLQAMSSMHLSGGGPGVKALQQINTLQIEASRLQNDYLNAQATATKLSARLPKNFRAALNLAEGAALDAGKQAAVAAKGADAASHSGRARLVEKERMLEVEALRLRMAEVADRMALQRAIVDDQAQALAAQRGTGGAGVERETAASEAVLKAQRAALQREEDFWTELVHKADFARLAEEQAQSATAEATAGHHAGAIHKLMENTRSAGARARRAVELAVLNATSQMKSTMAALIRERAKGFGRRPDVAKALQEVATIVGRRGVAADHAVSAIVEAEKKAHEATKLHDEAAVFEAAGQKAKAAELEDQSKLNHLAAESMMEQAESELVMQQGFDISGLDQGRTWGDGGVGTGFTKPQPSDEMAAELAPALRLEAAAKEGTAAQKQAAADSAVTVRRAYAQTRLQALVASRLEPAPLYRDAKSWGAPGSVSGMLPQPAGFSFGLPVHRTLVRRGGIAQEDASPPSMRVKPVTSTEEADVLREIQAVKPVVADLEQGSETASKAAASVASAWEGGQEGFAVEALLAQSGATLPVRKGPVVQHQGTAARGAASGHSPDRQSKVSPFAGDVRLPAFEANGEATRGERSDHTGDSVPMPSPASPSPAHAGRVPPGAALARFQEIRPANHDEAHDRPDLSDATDKARRKAAEAFGLSTDDLPPESETDNPYASFVSS